MNPTTVIKWPLLSRRNLSISAAIVLLVLIGIGQATRTSEGTAATQPPRHAATQAAATQAAPTQDAPTYSPDSPTPTDTFKDDPRHSDAATATLFATAWAKPALSQAEWLAGVTPYVTPALAKSLATTDPARVPATKVTGRPDLIKYGTGWAWVQVATDGGDIVLSMTSVPIDDYFSRWSVSNVQPADPIPTRAPTPKGAK